MFSLIPRTAVLLLFLSAASALAEELFPQDVMVEHLIFTRPEGWKWTPPENIRSVAKFDLPSKNEKFATDVDIRMSAYNAAESIPVWQGSFPEWQQPGNFLEEPQKIGTTGINYVSLLGRYKSPTGRRTLQGAKWVGVVLPTKTKKQFMQVRIFGPVDEVDAELDKFKKMVEDALRKP